MPVNKNAQFRYQILDRCFSDYHHKYDIDELLEIVNSHLEDSCGPDSVIRLRQLREDMHMMRSMLPAGVYLDAKKFDGPKCYYQYTKAGYSIYQNALSVEDVKQLSALVEMLSRYRGTPDNGWVDEVISNLEYRFGIKSNNENIVAFDQNQRLSGLQYLSTVIDATANHTPLRIVYTTYSGHNKDAVLHPYHVRQYNNRWFLFGYDETEQNISNKALDRIEHISVANVPFRPSTIDFAHYFDNVVGVSVPRAEDPQEKKQITLRFSEQRFPYILTKPIHNSQKIVDSEQFTVAIDVIPTRELEQQIFSFGPDVEVLTPEDYRQQIKQKFEEILKKY